MEKKNILVTGVAGFIGFHLCQSLISKGYFVVGIDDINDYYDVNLKYSRLKELGINKNSAIQWNKAINSDIYAGWTRLFTNSLIWYDISKFEEDDDLNFQYFLSLQLA